MAQSDDFTVTFLGVRGSSPRCEHEYQQYGGHTSCVMVDVGEQTIFFDAGSGLISANERTFHSTIHILLSHTHLDHIMGLPFFKALWNPNQEVHLYAANLKNYGGLRNTLKRVFSPPVFPIDFDDFKANITTHDVANDQPFRLGDVYVRMCGLNHPNGATGYRIDYREKSLCYVTDTEHDSGPYDQGIVEMIKGTNLFIYDASFDDETYPHHQGWGHSTWQEGCRLGSLAHVQRIALFHHDPFHTDNMMNDIAKRIQQQTSSVFLAKQGMTLTF